MTLDMAIKIAYDYADTKDVPKALMVHYADVAQKEIATNVSKLIKRFDISKTNTKEEHYPLPCDFIGIHKVIRRASALPVNWRTEGDMLVIADYGNIDIYYYSLPETIGCTNSGDYVFKVERRAQMGIPYYMASCIAKDYAIKTECLGEWNKIKALIKMAQPKERK